MELVKNLEHGLCHVYFHALPLLAIFLHKGEFYRKQGAEHARTDWRGKPMIFEPHYGCLISQSQFVEFNLSDRDIRKDHPVLKNSNFHRFSVMARSSVGLERSPDEREVVGSCPTGPTTFEKTKPPNPGSGERNVEETHNGV